MGGRAPSVASHTRAAFSSSESEQQARSRADTVDVVCDRREDHCHAKGGSTGTRSPVALTRPCREVALFNEPPAG
jgi:hypothetical protein